MNIIKKIRKIIRNDRLKIEIYGDEIIFNLYENEIPITYNREADTIHFKYAYCTQDDYFSGLNLNMMKEMTSVMELLDNNKNKFKEW